MSGSPDCYQEWWLHKWVRPAGRPYEEFKYVTKVNWCGPPSGVYGDVWLIYSDGTERPVPTGPEQFRPYKKDMEVRVEQQPGSSSS
jgi:hypothetical protein